VEEKRVSFWGGRGVRRWFSLLFWLFSLLYKSVVVIRRRLLWTFLLSVPRRHIVIRPSSAMQSVNMQPLLLLDEIAVVDYELGYLH
jgi:hypothetical protein